MYESSSSTVELTSTSTAIAGQHPRAFAQDGEAIRQMVVDEEEEHELGARVAQRQRLGRGAHPRNSAQRRVGRGDREHPLRAVHAHHLRREDVAQQA